jgi:hypothetical protein
MDFVAPAIIGLGFYFMYVAWTSHKNGTQPTPIANITTAIKGNATPATS